MKHFKFKISYPRYDSNGRKLKKGKKNRIYQRSLNRILNSLQTPNDVVDTIVKQMAEDMDSFILEQFTKEGLDAK